MDMLGDMRGRNAPAFLLTSYVPVFTSHVPDFTSQTSRASAQTETPFAGPAAGPDLTAPGKCARWKPSAG